MVFSFDGYSEVVSSFFVEQVAHRFEPLERAGQKCADWYRLRQAGTDEARGRGRRGARRHGARRGRARLFTFVFCPSSYVES